MKRWLPVSLFVVFMVGPMLACSLFAPDRLVFSPEQLPDGQVGVPYQAVITLTNQDTPAFSMEPASGSLPPGLTGEFNQDKQTYTISGIPTLAGDYPISISALCYGTNVSGQYGEIEYTVVVAE